MFPTQTKKHTWKGAIVEDRFSPSRDCDSHDSGFGSFPASPSSTNTAVDALPSHHYPQLSEDAPPILVDCTLYNTYSDVVDDEPACKMPRLLPKGEEEEEEYVKEIDQISTPTSPPLIVPEKDESNKSEQDAKAAEVKSVGKRVRITTPDENEDPYAKCLKPQHPCRWDACQEEFFDVNDLYDHTKEKHFPSLQPSSSSVVSPVSSISASQDRRKLQPDNDKEELASENKYRCQWRGCTMSLKRGTAEKKLEWLENHFRARHAPKAQPLKCLMSGCPIRFQNAKALTVHLLSSHDDKSAKRTPQQPVVRAIECFGYALPVRTETYGVWDFFDKRTFGLIEEKVSSFYKETNQESNDNVQEISEIPCMTRKKTINVLRKLFARK